MSGKGERGRERELRKPPLFLSSSFPFSHSSSACSPSPLWFFVFFFFFREEKKCDFG